MELTILSSQQENNFSIFDKITGKDELKAQVTKLKEELSNTKSLIEGYKKQALKREDDARKAISSKQKAEERLNYCEKKIETLENEIIRLKEYQSSSLTFKSVEELKLNHFISLLNKVESVTSDSSSFITIYNKAGQIITEHEKYQEITTRLDKNIVNLISKIKSSTGIIIFHDIDKTLSEVLVPPFPINEDKLTIRSVFETSPIKTILGKEYNICILLISAGESFVGIGDVKEFLNFKIVKSSVKSKHSKGGFSQRRFERLRNEDIMHHVDKVIETYYSFEEQFKVDFDYVILGGEEQLLSILLERVNIKYPIIKKGIEINVEKHNIERILLSATSGRRYIL